MPIGRYRLRRRRPTYRRRVRRRVTYGRRRMGRKMPLMRAIGLPKQIYAKLKYSEISEVNLLAASTYTQLYRLNSLFDPNETSTGGQPYYFDQYAALFQRYRVFGCKVEVTISTSSSTTNLFHPSVALLSWAGTAPSWGNLATAINSKRTVYRQLIPGQTVAVLKKYYDCAAVAGVSKNEYHSTDTFQAATSANPTRTCNVQLYVENNDAVAAITVQYTIRMTFYCKFFDNAEPAAS